MAQKTADPPARPRPYAPPPPERAAPRTPRGRRRSWGAAAGAAKIPVVNDAHEIVGWTQTAPVVESGRLRHPEVDRVLHGPIYCTQVALVRAQDIRHAGGPADWVGPWRCLALCPIGNGHGQAQPDALRAADPRERARAPAPLRSS
jgi:hypothetical protein